MKAISLWQPYATLIWWQFKTIETRSWKPTDAQLQPMQWLAIHAAKSAPAAAVDAAMELPGIKDALTMAGINRWNRTQANVPMGVILALAQVQRFESTETLRGTISSLEADCGNYAAGRWGWVLTNVMRLHRPVHCPGRQGLWTVPRDVAVKVVAELISCGQMTMESPRAKAIARLYDGNQEQEGKA